MTEKNSKLDLLEIKMLIKKHTMKGVNHGIIGINERKKLTIIIKIDF